MASKKTLNSNETENNNIKFQYYLNKKYLFRILHSYSSISGMIINLYREKKVLVSTMLTQFHCHLLYS